MKFPDPQILTPQVMENIVKSINAISMTSLKDFDRPIKIYSDFIEKYPNHPYTPTLKIIIEKFKILKAQKVNIILKKNERSFS